MFVLTCAIIVFLATVVGGVVIRNTAARKYAGPKYRADEINIGMQRARFASITTWCVGVFLTALLLSMTSWVSVGKYETAQIVRIYGGGKLPSGRIVAFDGEKGPQADILGPGFHISPLIRVLNDIESSSVFEIPEGKYGLLVAMDGAPLRPNQFMADAWPDGKDMLDATTFLRNGGQKGPQLNVLTPGQYRLNKYLWTVTTGDATDIKEGFVGVVKSNVHANAEMGNLIKKRQEACWQQKVTAKIDDSVAATLPDEGRLTAVLVPVGCIGVWDAALNPGRYYINHRAFQITTVDTRVQTWEYKGGYDFRQINLVIDDEGKITQRETVTKREVPKGAADSAILPRIEGWVVPVELRVLVQVTGENAPFVVASVGGITEVEDRIMTPTIRSIVRNVLGQEGRRVLELADNRGDLEQAVETAIRPEGLKAGIVVKEIRFGDPAIPPELLVSRLRQQLAIQMQETFKQEKAAQTARIDREREKATADQQTEFVKSEIGVKVAERNKEAAQLRGQGVKLEQIEVALGQKAQTEVPGQDRVLTITLVKEILATLEKKPELVKMIEKLVPNTVVTGSGGFDLAGAAALLKGAGK